MERSKKQQYGESNPRAPIQYFHENKHGIILRASSRFGGKEAPFFVEDLPSGTSNTYHNRLSGSDLNSLESEFQCNPEEKNEISPLEIVDCLDHDEAGIQPPPPPPLTLQDNLSDENDQLKRQIEKMTMEINKGLDHFSKTKKEFEERHHHSSALLLEKDDKIRKLEATLDQQRRKSAATVEKLAGENKSLRMIVKALHESMEKLTKGAKNAIEFATDESDTMVKEIQSLKRSLVLARQYSLHTSLENFTKESLKEKKKYQRIIAHLQAEKIAFQELLSRAEADKHESANELSQLKSHQRLVEEELELEAREEIAGRQRLYEQLQESLALSRSHRQGNIEKIETGGNNTHDESPVSLFDLAAEETISQSSLPAAPTRKPPSPAPEISHQTNDDPRVQDPIKALQSALNGAKALLHQVNIPPSPILPIGISFVAERGSEERVASSGV